MTDFASVAANIATTLRGPPNPRLSRPGDLRFGVKGSLSVNTKTATYFDFEAGEGGGILALIQRETGTDAAGALRWAQDTGLIETEYERDQQAIARQRQMRIDRERARATEIAAKHRAAAARAANLWQTMKPASPRHLYLRRKSIGPGIAREYKGALVLPITSWAGEIASLQFIGASGQKKLLAGGRKQGRLIMVAAPRDPARVLICEGYATAMSLSEAAAAAIVVSAIDSGNLPSVAIGARDRWPDAAIVICGDCDPAGIAAANRAARLASASVSFPIFPAGSTGTDYNDLAAALRAQGGAG